MNDIQYIKNIDGTLNISLYNRMKRLVSAATADKHLPISLAEDVLNDLVISWLEKPGSEDRIYNRIGDIIKLKYMKHIRRDKGDEELKNMESRSNMIDELFPDYSLPIDIMCETFSMPRRVVLEFIGMRVDGCSLAEISRFTGKDVYFIKQLDDYLRDYFDYLGRETIKRSQLRILPKPTTKNKQYRYGFGDNPLPAPNNPVKNYYVYTFLNVKKLCDLLNVEFFILASILDDIKANVLPEEIQKKYQVNNDRWYLLNGFLLTNPKAVLISREPFSDCGSYTSSPLLYSKGIVKPDFKKKNTKKHEFSPKKFDYFLTCVSMENIKDILTHLNIEHSIRYEKGSAEEYVVLHDECPRCGRTWCIQIHFLKRRCSWCCNGCRDRFYGKPFKGERIKMKDFYLDYPNSLEGVLSFLGFNVKEELLCQ